MGSIYDKCMGNLRLLSNYYKDEYGMEISYIFNADDTIVIEFNNLRTFNIVITIELAAEDEFFNSIVRQYTTMCVNHCSKGDC